MGKGHGDLAKERGLPFLPCSFGIGVASWASWKISRSSDRSQTCSWEGCVSRLLPEFWNPSQLLATDSSPSSQDTPSPPSIHHTGPSSYPPTGLSANPASASLGSSMSCMSHRCLCSVNSHIVRPVWGSLGRGECLPRVPCSSAEGSCPLGSLSGIFGYDCRRCL